LSKYITALKRQNFQIFAAEFISVILTCNPNSSENLYLMKKFKSIQQLIKPSSGNLSWLIDQEAGCLLSAAQR
jgi:hypothetical protein